MTPPGALFATAGLLGFVALVLTLSASEFRRPARTFMYVTGWTCFVLAVAGAAGAAWWEALS